MADILSDVARYYSEKLHAHGTTPQGVDWNSTASQQLRMAVLLEVVDSPSGTLLDVGCGYGAALPVITDRYPGLRYAGYDIAEEMVAAAVRLHGDAGEFFTRLPDGRTWDWAIASGIFNVRLGHDDEAWRTYLHKTLDTMDALTDRGFAFNVLTSYSDADRKRPDLYYADPLELFDRCKLRFSRFVVLRHDYPLYEFTIIVRKAAT